MHYELLTDLKECTKEQLISLVGGLLLSAEDLARAYGLNCEMAETLSEVLTEHEIEHRLVENDL